MPMIRPRKGAHGERRWQWRVKLKGYPARHGTCPTKECARQCARRAEERLKSGAVDSAVTVAELIGLYAAAYLPTIPDSAALYRRHLAYWRGALGPCFASAVRPQDVSQHREYLRTQSSRFGRPLSPATVNRYLNTLSSVYAWATRADVGLLDRNPVRQVTRLQEPPGRTRFLSRPLDEQSSELQRLIGACRESESPLLLDVVLLLLSTGCRENEVMRLRRDQIRPAEGGFTLTDTKTDEPRFVALAGVGLEVVLRRLAAPRRFGNNYLFPGSGRNRPSGFPWRAWRTALRRAQIVNFRPHDLRHTHGSYLAMMGKSLREIMEALGHKTPAVAIRYSHLADSHRRAVSDHLNSQLADWIAGL